MKKAVLSLSIFIIFIAVLAWLFAPKAGLYVSAVDVSPRSELKKLLDLQPGTVDPWKYRIDLSQLVVESDEDKVKVSASLTQDKNLQGVLTLHELDGYTYTEGKNRVMLSALSLNYPGQGAGVPASQNTGTYYAPDGQILSKKALVDGLLNKDGLSYNDPRLSPPDFGDKYTGLKMWLEVDALDDFRFLKGWILDARTGRQLNLSGFYHDHDFIVPWSAPIPMLHPGPVRIVVDIAFGPGRDYTLPAQIGAHVDLKHTSLHLLDIRKGRWRGSSMSSDSKSMTGEYEADVGYNEICLIVAMETTASLPFDIFYEKSDGSLVDLSFGSTNNFLQLNCPDLLGPDDNLMIREYEQVKRLVFTLPRLPGLPEENLGVDNLAAVKIPYVKLDSRRDLSRVAAAYLQVKYVNDREHGLKGGKEFPMVLKDTTPAEMLRLYMSYESKPGVLVVDPLRDEVRIEDNLAQKVSAWVRKKLNF